MKKTVTYGRCEMFVEGLDMECPLCKKLVKSGERHECERTRPRRRRNTAAEDTAPAPGMAADIKPDPTPEEMRRKIEEQRRQLGIVSRIPTAEQIRLAKERGRERKAESRVGNILEEMGL